MRKSLTAVLLFLASIPLGAQCLSQHSLDKDSLAFKGGERLTFSIHYRWGIINADVASATLSLEETVFNGSPVFSARLYGRSAKKFDAFFRMKEDFRSWFSQRTLRPVRFTRDTHEGNYTALNNLTFDWRNMKIHADMDNSSLGKRQLDMDLAPCVFDVISMAYNVRNFDRSKIELGTRVPVTFAIDDDIYTIYFIFQSREQVSVKGAGVFNGIKTYVKLVQGDMFGNSDDISATIWFSDDDNMVPLKFDAPLKVGKVTGRLRSWEGLKYEW
ncbi:MAG: DUF3108 domain-containing protein [Candidatus Cryptobacteroides sp.]|nr:DUF3108 domain-containing protein [Candidatus Cryptobacteroides sp.]